MNKCPTSLLIFLKMIFIYSWISIENTLYISKWHLKIIQIKQHQRLKQNTITQLLKSNFKEKWSYYCVLHFKNSYQLFRITYLWTVLCCCFGIYCSYILCIFGKGPQKAKTISSSWSTQTGHRKSRGRGSHITSCPVTSEIISGLGQCNF